MCLVFGKGSFVSYSHSRPGRLRVYVTGTVLRNHSNKNMWNSATAHAVAARADAVRIAEEDEEDEEASRVALVNILKTHRFADEPRKRFRKPE
jgi:hypothetical protein